MNKYTNQLSTLKTAKIAGVQAPHKPILLLSVIDLIECGVINENHISLSEDLESVFKSNWLRYVGNSVLFQPKVATPYWHLQNEPFWRLIRPDSGIIDVSVSFPKVSAETAKYHPIPTIVDFTDEHGKNTMAEQIGLKYDRIKEDVSVIISSELERIKGVYS